MFTYSAKKSVLIVSFFVSSLLLNTAQASENQPTTKTQKTISYQGINTINKEERTLGLTLAKAETLSAELQQAFKAPTNTAARHDTSAEYRLFDVSTDLVSDFDFDGFFHRFSVTLDADTVFTHSEVYADLYLSYEGGPWIYYATSNAYDIYYDSASDRFTIETELADGYPTGYYNLQIKLYDAITDEYLLTYDSYDDNSLLDIPLEDSYRDSNDYDGYYEEAYSSTEIIVSHGAGSMGLYSFIALLIIVIAVRGIRKYKK